MRALTIRAENSDVAHRLNADCFQRLSADTDGVWIEFAANPSEPTGNHARDTLFLSNPAGAALLAWWDKRAEHITIVREKPTAAGDADPAYIPAVGDRVRVIAHGPFAPPETYRGVVDGIGEMVGTPVAYVIYDDGNMMGELFTALEKE